MQDAFTTYDVIDKVTRPAFNGVTLTNVLQNDTVCHRHRS